MGSIEKPDASSKASSLSFDQMDPPKIKEFNPIDCSLTLPSCGIDSGHTSPSYCDYPHHHPQEYADGQQYGAPTRPNLYLYSPSNNTLIPCDEIIIPNPVMSREGPVYSGPTNIYLAYPVQGQDGRGYSTQPFLPPGSAGSYMSQDGCSYSPSISNDGSTQYSSTPHTTNSGDDSGSSTQPTSPPPLFNCHPTNWTNQEQTTLSPLPQDMYYPHPIPSITEGYYDPQPVDKSTDKPSRLTCQTSTPSYFSPALKSDVTSTTVRYIPGLPQDSLVNRNKKSKKRRKKKTKTESIIYHRGSTSSESEINNCTDSRECNNSQAEDVIILECKLKAGFPELAVEQIQEIQLTDDLADSLVNPPTDPENSDDESKSLFHFEQTKVKKNEIYHKTSKFVHNSNKDKIVKTFHVVELEDKKITINRTDKVEFEAEIDVADFNVKAAEEECESFNESLNKECVVTINECTNKKDQKNEKNVPDLENSNNKVLIRKNKSKTAKKAVSDTKFEMINTLTTHAGCPVTMPKSYSSVIKSSLVTAPNNLTISSQSLVSAASDSSPSVVSAVPVSSPIALNLVCPAAKTRSDQESDNHWENVPLSVSKPESWKKTSKKRKHKSKYITFDDSPITQEIPDLNELTPVEKSSTMTNSKVVTREDVIEEEIAHVEQEVKKLRRRKKKVAIEDPEESNAGHRVVICDEQISLHYYQEGRESSSPLYPSLVDKVKNSCYSDFLLVSELGSNIFRGSMDLGRLYQGKYVAPERSDGLIYLPDEEESLEENASDQVICQESAIADSDVIGLD